MTSGIAQSVTVTAPPDLRATINPEGLEVQAAWVRENETANFFDNDLTVTLNEFSCVDYTIDFMVGSPGFSNAKATNARAGHTVIQIGKHPYEVRLSKEGNHLICNSAEFQVTKLKEIPPPTPTSEPIMLITIRIDETQTLFEGDLFITLFDVRNVSPSESSISGVIGSSSYQNQEIKSLKLGGIMTYQAKDLYEIRLTDVSGSSAELRITKLQEGVTTPTPDEIP